MYRVYYDGSSSPSSSHQKLGTALRRVRRDIYQQDLINVVILDTETGFQYTVDERGNFVGILPQEEVR